MTSPRKSSGLIARGLGVGWVPGLLAEDTHGIVSREIDSPARHRDVYALLPPGERHPHARHVLAALQKSPTTSASARGHPVPTGTTLTAASTGQAPARR